MPREIPNTPSTPAMFEDVYAELRALASSWWRHRQGGETLQPTALVHEAYLKLAPAEGGRWTDEEHFRATAATAMRHALVSHARKKGADKRGGDWGRVTLSGLSGESGAQGVDLLALEEALTKLESMHHRHGRVVELRYFAGLTEPQIARVLGVSERTVSADWRAARAWLLNELGPRAS
ncbi:MAG: ECF-type sigma factor [Phycisphaerales bacterium JB041]